MSPASRSKPKEKSSARSAKEQQKSSKVSVPGTTENGAPASAYNPLLGTFHTLDTAPPVSFPPPHSNSRFRNIDRTDEQSGSSVGTGAEYDSVSNNDSCSGESEDHKDKILPTNIKQDSIPGCDNDKREKIRQKNERKHQRQRERRAQELHERCSGYLISRKLEALARQLVAMGFSSERATMALILNEGRIEKSVAWLFEGGEESAQQKSGANLDGGGSNLKIDITEELSRIAGLEIKYGFSKQEVERAVVACEGDLEKASENLKAQKQLEQPPSLPKTDDTSGDQQVLNTTSKMPVSASPNLMKPPARATTGPITIQQRKDDRDFNYTKATVEVATSVVASPESLSRNLQSLRKSQSKPEWARPPVQVAAPVEKRWLPNGGSSSSSASYSLAPPLQGSSPPPQPAAKVKARYAVTGSEGKSLQSGAVREPVIMMQRPQSINAKQNNNITPAANISTSPPRTAGWYPPNHHSNSSPNVEVLMKSNAGDLSSSPYIPSPRNSAWPSIINPQQFYQQSHYQQQQQQQQQQPFMSNPNLVVDASGGDTWGGNSNLWNNTATGMLSPSSTSSLTVPSSLGLFSGWGPAGGPGSTSSVDWSTGGSMSQLDYTNIDWTLESASNLKPSKNSWWVDLASSLMSNRDVASSLMNNSRMYDSWAAANTFTPAGLSQSPTKMMRSANLNVAGGVYKSAGLQQEGLTTASTATVTISASQQGPPSSSSVVPPPHEWTSPFAGKDLFSLPRQFVTSPSL